MPNHLTAENSLYLLQHAENPVDWYPWGPEAMDKARSEDKPIFLSIGYAACHWCHVMAHESFENSRTATIMNENFINIKVDREERPDLDSIYMQAVISITGQGGWPMSVFLTTDGDPFFGGTYFPPARRNNMPAFRDVLLTIARLWMYDRSQLLESSTKIKFHIEQNMVHNQVSRPLSIEILNKAVYNLGLTYDWENGGWGKAPKFPQPMSIEFLLRKATRGDKHARDMATHALLMMAKGGMYDVIGGGFARYSTDDSWCIPHFEKMLYDNAQLALAYLHCWLVTKDDFFRHVCEHTLNFIKREMSHPMGGFYSSLDADSDGEEGKFYIWTKNEIQAILRDTLDINLFTAAYDITESGNFQGANVLHRVRTDNELAELFNISRKDVFTHLEKIHQLLFAARESRTRPATDDKIIVSWNGLALAAFAEAARYLGRSDYLTVAQLNAKFLTENLIIDERLFRSWRKGQAKHKPFLEDYASLAIGLLSLYQSDANVVWYSTAIQLTDKIMCHFTDSKGGFFDTSDDHEPLIVRPKDMQDNATPSGNALTASLLLQLAAYEGSSERRKIGEDMLSEIQNSLMQFPSAFGQWLQATDFALGPTKEVALLGDPNDLQTQALLNTMWKNYHPRLVTAVSKFPPEKGSPSLVINRGLHNGLPTAYVCQGFVCSHPTNSPNEMATQLDDQITS